MSRASILPHVIIAAVVLGAELGVMVACSVTQDKTQAKLAAISAGCEVALGEAGTPGEVEQMAQGCTTALRLLDPMRGDAGK